MMYDENTYHQIELFLAGELSDTELATFQERLGNDTELAELVENHLLTNELIKGQQLANVKAMMDADFKEGKVHQTNNKKWWWLGGLVTTGVLLYAGIHSQSTNDVNKEISIDEPQIVVNALSEKSTKIEEKSEVEILTNQKIVSKTKDETTSTKADSKVDEVDVSVESVLTEPLVLIDKPLKKAVAEPIEVTLTPEIIQPKSEVKCAIEARALVNTQPSCIDQNTGRLVIQLQTVVNAKKPYQFKIEDAYGKAVVQQNATFTALMSEYYNISLIDANNCTLDLARDVFVDIKECKNRETASFNPNYGEVFELPAPKEDEAVIVIYSKYGKEVFHRLLSTDNSEVWDGKNSNGETVGAGVYIYKISYKTLPQEVGEVLVY